MHELAPEHPNPHPPNYLEQYFHTPQMSLPHPRGDFRLEKEECDNPLCVRDSLRLWCVVHGLLVLVLCSTGALSNLLLTVSSFFVELDKGAETAAAGECEIGQARTLEVILLADVGTLHPERDEGETDAGRGDDEKAL
jgi:hypothetical protein